MIKYKANCKVCQCIKKDKKLMNRIYDTSFYIKHSKDTLKSVWEDQEKIEPGSFTYVGLLNHVKKHQSMNAADHEKKMLAIKAKQAEISIIQERFDAQAVQDAVMNVGMDALQKGEIKVSTRDLLRAARDKADIMAKKADQTLQLAQMVAFFASAEDKQGEEQREDRRIIDIEDYDPAIPVAEYTDPRA